MGSPLNERQQVLDMLQKAANEADAKARVEYSEFWFDGKIEANVTAEPSPTDTTGAKHG